LKKPLDDVYCLINLIFIGVILLIFLYSIVFSADKSNYPVPSAYTKITGKESISNGLSRSFSEMIRFDIKKAREYNIYGPRIFLFFLLQLLLRIFFTAVVLNFSLTRKPVILIDICLTFILYSFSFFPFYLELFTTL